jgi:putative inorganic carbon (hco3(-)) transporter
VRSIFFTTFFLFILVTAVRAPFVAGLLYVWVDLLVPQRVAFGFIEQIPLALISGAASLMFYFLFDKKERIHLGTQWVLLVALFVWITISTVAIAKVPEFAWIKWNSAYKTIIFAAFMPFMFRTRVRLESLILTILTCVGVVSLSLAIKTILGGGGYGSTRIWGDVNGTVLGESSTFALAAASIIPFIVVLAKDSVLLPPKKYIKIGSRFAIGLIVIAIIGSYARTGLVCLGILGAIAFWRSKSKFIFILVGLIVVAIGTPLLPESWKDRMNTIQEAQTETSASSRLAVWGWTIGFVGENPLGGGFDCYRLNELEVTIKDPSRPNDPTAVTKIKMRARAFHSIYFEILGEQGWPGFIILMSLFIITLAKSWKIWRAHKTGSKYEWLSALAGANFVSTLMVMVGGAFVGIAYSAITYYPVVISLALMNLHRKTEDADDAQLPANTVKPELQTEWNLAARNSRPI